MKLNMKLMAAVVLAASTLGMAGNTYAAFNFAAFQVSLPASVVAANPVLVANLAAPAANIAAQAVNAPALAAVQAVVKVKQADLGISGF